METFAHISIQQTQDMSQEKDIRIVDIRDEQSFNNGHIEGSYHLTNGSLTQFVQDTDFETAVVVCCYHGHSSQQAAQFLIHQGFDEVYSLDGGFEEWKKVAPFVVTQD